MRSLCGRVLGHNFASAFRHPTCNTNLFGVDNPNKSSLARRHLNTVVYGYRATGLPKFASNGVAYFKTSAFFSDQGN